MIYLNGYVSEWNAIKWNATYLRMKMHVLYISLKVESNLIIVASVVKKKDRNCYLTFTRAIETKMINLNYLSYK